MMFDDYDNPGGANAGGDPATPAPSGANGWLPPGATINGDGSITLANGSTIPAPPPGYSRDPNTGVVAYTGASGAPTVAGLDPTDPNKPNAPWTAQTPKGPDPQTPNPGTPPPAPAPGPGPASLIQPFTTPYVPAGSASANPTPLPTVAGSVSTIPGAPAFPTIPRFTAPTMAEAMNDDGYKFVLDQGNTNLQNWAAARGTLNDSSTAKAFIDYGQGAATTQYGNVWDRALRSYEENVGTQYLQPWQAAFQTWQTGTAAPTMQNFTTNAANVSHLNDVNWQDAWNAYLDKENIFRDQRDSTFDKQFKTATA